MKKWLVILVACLFVVSGITVASAKDKGFKDMSFVKDAAPSGVFEVEAGKVASEKAQNPEVKSFAQKMVTDHSAVNQELMSIAEKKGVKINQQMDKSRESMMGKIQKQAPKDFDKEYMDIMVKEHKDAVKLFEKEAKNGKDAEMKAFAAKTLPALKEHLQMAEQLYDKIKGK